MSAEDTSEEPGQQIAFQVALLLGRLRALRAVPATVSESVLAAAAAAAAQTGRRVIRVHDAARGTADMLVLGWDNETAPVPGLVAPSGRLGLSPVPTLVWAACLRAAWPKPELAPFPGQTLQRTDILSLCCSGLGADRDVVERALDRILPEAQLIVAEESELRLGAAVAALPPAVVEGLRRRHHLLPVREEREPADRSAPLKGRASARKVPVDAGQVPEASDHHVVRSAIATLETSRRPLPRNSLPALTDPAMYSMAKNALLPCGRDLQQTPEGTWATGFCDPVADALVDEGTGTLTAEERAVLALVLLHTVAIPRAQGRHRHSRWTGEPHAVTLTTLASNRRIPKVTMRAALRRLKAAGMVAESTAGHYVPGPALERLSEYRSSLLWEDLILAGRPDGHLAAAIRRRRGLSDPLRQDGSAEMDRA